MTEKKKRRNLRVKIKLDEGAKCPTRSYPMDAGLDLYSREDREIYPMKIDFHETRGLSYYLKGGETFDTGVHMEIPEGYFGKIESRSGLNVKHNIVSCGGVIDCGFVGSIKVKLYNLGSEPYTVKAGDKIAQIVLIPCITPDLQVVDELDESERGSNGIGSTGY